MYNMVSFMLRYYREKCGYTQQNVADLLSIERSTYTYYETGKTMPDIRTLMMIAKIFGVSYTDLLEGTGDDEYLSLKDFTVDMEEQPLTPESKIYVNTTYEKELVQRVRLLTPTQRREIMLDVRDYSDANLKGVDKPIRKKRKKKAEIKADEIDE